MFFFLKPQWIISLCLKFNIFAPDKYPGPGCLRSLGRRGSSISCCSLSVLGGLYGRDGGQGGSGEGREKSYSCYCSGFRVEAAPSSTISTHRVIESSNLHLKSSSNHHNSLKATEYLEWWQCHEVHSRSFLSLASYFPTSPSLLVRDSSQETSPLSHFIFYNSIQKTFRGGQFIRRL